MIGDCRGSALVSRTGTIDWLCWPRFDSPSLLGALLDDQAGQWSIHPTCAFRSHQSYIRDTNVLQTRFECASGIAVLTDLMTVASEEEKHRHLMSEQELLRSLRCESGQVELEMMFQPRPHYGARSYRMRDAGALGVRLELPDALMVLLSEMPLRIESDATVVGRVTLRAGQAVHSSLTFCQDGPAVIAPLGDAALERIDRSVRWWRSWLWQSDYSGPQREAVMRSALVLKLLVYAPSGAVVAAPTTSLPERVGGDLNWDYRYCWLRDASLTVRALLGLGFHHEAQSFVSWLLHSTRLSQPELRVLYDVHGNRPQPERTLPHLDGYHGSRPVRVGNAAAHQLQLDVYGEVIDAVTQLVGAGVSLDRETQRVLRAFGSYVAHHWRDADEGIWEPRSGRAPHTHSRVLCWLALDNLLKLHEQGHLGKLAASKLGEQRDLIGKEVRERGWNRHLGSYVAELDGNALDASLLLLAWYGFEPAEGERMRRTYAHIRERLRAGRHLLYRYRDSESPGEGAFGICSFWEVEYLALGGGSYERAHQAFAALCDYATETGLYGEEIDPHTGRALGNFPQAFTHVGLINAALTLARRKVVWQRNGGGQR